MKIRSGFVSNSSSSSFVIAKTALTEEQIEQIKNHQEIAKKMGEGLSEHGFGCLDSPWSIFENNYYVEGRTDMNNFDMFNFLGEIGVPLNVVRWEQY